MQTNTFFIDAIKENGKLRQKLTETKAEVEKLKGEIFIFT